MIKNLYYSVVVCLLATLSGTASAKSTDQKIEDLWVNPTSTGLYLVEQVTQGGQKMLRIGLHRGSEPILWDTVNGKARSVTTLADSLYVAFDDGTILQPGGQVLGKLPQEAVPERLVSDQKQNRLFVLARQKKPTSTRSSTGPALQSTPWQFYELISGKWALLPALPNALLPQDHPAVLADNGRVDLFNFSPAAATPKIHHWSFQDGNWVLQPDLDPGKKIQGLYPLALNGVPVLVLSLSAGEGEQLVSWPVLDGTKSGPLSLGSARLILTGPYDITAETDRILVGFLTEDRKQIHLARWSKEGEVVGKVEAVNPTPATEKQDNSLIFTMLLVAVILTIFLSRGKTVFLGDTLPEGLMLPAYWRRGLSFLIDLLMVYFVVILVLATFWYNQYHSLFDERMNVMQLMEAGQMDPRMYIIAIATSIGYAAYCMVLEGFLGWTVGKWLLGLEVRQSGKITDRPTWLQAFLRNVVKIVEINIWPLLFVMLLTRSRQRIGDLVAGTVVLQRQVNPDVTV